MPNLFRQVAALSYTDHQLSGASGPNLTYH
jgi:hypothetical protein